MYARRRIALLAVVVVACFGRGKCSNPAGGGSPLTRQDVAERLSVAPETVDRIRQERGTDLDVLVTFSGAQVARAQRRTVIKDHPGAAVAFRVRQNQGMTPSDTFAALTLAQEQRRAMQDAELRARVANMRVGRPKSPSAALLPFEAGIDRNTWRSLGPTTIAGRTRALAVHPANSEVVLAASPAGGIWRSTNGGAGWAPTDDFMANLAVSALVFDPTRPDIAYAGTGEGFYNLDAIQGAGIFKTEDGGATWSRLAATAAAPFQFVNRLAVTSDGATLLAATRTGSVQRSVDGGTTWAATRGAPADVSDVRCSPRERARCLASGFVGEVSYSEDGGATWQSASGVGRGGRVELTFAAADPSVVYASIDLDNGTLFRSEDGGKHFAATSSPPGFLGRFGWYANAIWAGDPHDANLVVVGGADLRRSTNGGRTLEQISNWIDEGSVHADQHVIIAAPTYDARSHPAILVGTDGGVYRSENVRTVRAGDAWTPLNTNYVVTQFYSVAVVPDGSILGGTQDNGTLRYLPNEGWHTVLGGDGGECAASPADADVMYGEYIRGNVFRSTGGGATVEFISGLVVDDQGNASYKRAPYRIDDADIGADPPRAAFVAPILLDPSNPDRLYVGGVSLWRTENARAPNGDQDGPSWAAVKPAIAGGAPISAVAISPSNPDVGWVCHEDGRVFRTSSATSARPRWTEVSLPTPGRYCHRILLPPGDPSAVYVALGGYAADNVWRSADGGSTWKSIAGNGRGWNPGALPLVPIRAIAVHPAKKSFVYVGTDVGVFATENGGGKWSAVNDGPTNCPVDDLVWNGRTLIAATHGRGVFSADLR